MTVILRPSAKVPLSGKWKAALWFFGIVAVLIAQQPVTVSNATMPSTPVTGTFWQSTQPVSIASMPTTPVTGTFWQATQAVSGTFWQATQPVSFGPISTSGGATTMYHHVSSTSAGLNIKASAGNLYGFVAFNPNPTGCYLQFYNNASVPTIGTSVIDAYGVEAGLTVQVLPGSVALENFSTGIAYATATADAGATACTTGMSVSIFYQ